MPIDFEDTISGGTDISGDPPMGGARTAGNIRSATQGKVNRQQRGGQQQNQNRNPLQGVGDFLGGAAKGAGDAIGEAFNERPFQDQGDTPFSGWSPIDWGKQVANDAEMSYSLGRRAYRGWLGLTDPNRTDQSIHHTWQGSSAFDRFNQVLGSLESLGPTPADPLGSLQNRLSAVHQLAQAGQQIGQGEDPAQIAGQAIQEREPDVKRTEDPSLREALNPINYTGAGRGSMAAQLLAPIAQAALSQDPDDRDSAILWGTLAAGIFGAGRIPGPVREQMAKIFGEGWAPFEQKLNQTLNRQQEADRASVDPAKAPQAIKDWIGEQINKGALNQRYSKPLARAPRPGDPQRIQAEVGEHGEIRLMTDEAKAGVRKLLNRVGVDDVDALVHKALIEGISDPVAMKAVRQNWKQLDLPYDLKRYQPEEMPLRDPRRHLEELADSQAATKHTMAIHHYLDQIHRGLFANHSDPMTAVLRSLAGHSRATQLTHQQYMATAVDALKDWGLTDQNMSKLMRATEGDSEVYNALPPEAKMVADGWGLIRAASREEAQGTDYAQHFASNWVPRTDKLPEEMQRGRGRPSSSAVLARESDRRREESLQVDPHGQLVLGQRFQYVQDANKALAAARAAGKDYPDKEANFLKNVNRVMGNQIRAIHTHQALNEFTKMRAADGRKAAVKPENQRNREELSRAGYQAIDDSRFQSFLFHPDLAESLGRYINHTKGPQTKMGAFWQKALDLEGEAIKYIMFSPLVHGLNVAGRMGMAGLMHPIQMAHYLTNGGPLLPHTWDETSWRMRSEAYNGGLLPRRDNKSYMDNVISRYQDALGDEGDALPRLAEPDTKTNRLKQLVNPLVQGEQKVNNYFWGMVNDFGVMMYHLERTAAERHGLGKVAAQEYAGRRANTWMGMVAPEDTNRIAHDIGRLVLFAPNWWRTWAELAAPMYRRAGFTQDANYAKFAAYQGAKTTMAALAFQKMSGNLLNFLLTSDNPLASLSPAGAAASAASGQAPAFNGHLQSENQPGAQDKVEATGAWLNDLPGFAGQPQTDPRTGARRTVENPLARQTYDIEQAAGKQSGKRDYQPEDTWDGLAKFMVSRASPIFDSAWGAFNIDLYRSVSDHEFRGLDPMEKAGSVSPGSLLYGAMMLTPFGISFSQKVQQGMDQGDTSPVESALGTRVPRSVGEAVKDIGDPVGRTMFSWLTGVNPPYELAERSRGQKPSDQDYQRATQLKTEYQQQMLTLSNEALSGQMTPSQWRQAYHDLSQKHAAATEALYKGAPEYVNGAQGMVSDWEKLYQDPSVVKPDGTTDQDRLAQLQAEFRSKHTADQLQQMDAQLHQNDSKYPMLGLYHHALDNHTKWQEQWATKNNVDLGVLRTEAREYGALYGDARGQRQYLSQHRDLARYETAKKREWNRSMPGMIYSLFYGQSATAVNYMRTHHLTPEQLIQQESQVAA